MIKGVNRQVIEISDPSSLYYERAWLIIKPEYTRIQHSVLEKEANKLIRNATPPSAMRPKRSFGFWALRLGISATAGAVLALSIEWLLF